MFFIGVIANHQKFKNLNNTITKRMNKKEIQLININKDDVENFKTVKLDSIVILNSLEEFEEETLQEIFKNTKYLIINSDINLKTSMFSNIRANVITFGTNHKATVTFSSITDENILISVQRSFTGLTKNMVELGEYSVNIDKMERTYLYENLVEFIVEKLYVGQK